MKKLIFTAIILMTGVGLYLDDHLSKTKGRQIASLEEPEVTDIGTQPDLSQLSPEEFSKAFKYALLNRSTLVVSADHQGIQLGSFLVQGSTSGSTTEVSEQRISVCDKFRFLEMVFEAEGISSAGDIPQMTVRGSCLSTENSNFIQGLMIPYKTILSAPASQQKFQEEAPENSSASHPRVSIYFHNMVDRWPLQWNLKGIKLYSDDSGEVLSLTGYEAIAVLGQPLTLDWSNRTK